MAATKSASAIIARGTSNAAFTQLTANAATTRSGTTATLTMASTATLSTNDYCLIQGHDIEEYNGVFQVTVASGTTITYTIKQDPGASSGTTSGMTVDKVTFGTALDMTTDYGAQVALILQNGGTGPTIAPQVWKGVGTTSSLVDYTWRQLFAGDSTAKSYTPWVDTVDISTMYVNYIVCRNTGQAVDCCAIASHVTAG